MVGAKNKGYRNSSFLLNGVSHLVYEFVAFNNGLQPDLLMEYSYGGQSSIFNIYQQIASQNDTLSFTQFNHLQNKGTNTRIKYPVSQDEGGDKGLFIPSHSLVMKQNESGIYVKTPIGCNGIEANVTYVISMEVI